MFGGVQSGRASGEVPNTTYFFIDIGEVEVNESGYLGFFLHDGGIAVDKEGASQRVRGIVYIFGRWFHPIHMEDVQAVGVFLVVSITKVPNGVGATFHPLHQHIVILAQLQVGGCQNGFFTCIPKYLFYKVVKCARVGARAETLDGFGRPGGVNI